MNSRKQYNSGFSVVIVILIVVIVAFGGTVGWLAYRNYQKPTTASVTTKTSTVMSNPYTGWKTYTTSDGVSFRYPPSWTLNTQNSPYLLSSPANSQTNLQFNFGYRKYTNSPPNLLSDTVVSNQSLGIGAVKPLYLLTLDFKSSTGGDVDGLYVMDNNAAKGGAIVPGGFAAKSDGIISFYAVLEPSYAQNNGGQTLATYQSNSDYQTVIDVFKSLSD